MLQDEIIKIVMLILNKSSSSGKIDQTLAYIQGKIKYLKHWIHNIFTKMNRKKIFIENEEDIHFHKNEKEELSNLELDALLTWPLALCDSYLNMMFSIPYHIAMYSRAFEMFVHSHQ